MGAILDYRSEYMEGYGVWRSVNVCAVARGRCGYGIDSRCSDADQISAGSG